MNVHIFAIYLQNVTDLADISVYLCKRNTKKWMGVKKRAPRLLIVNLILMDRTERNMDIVKAKLLYGRIKLRLLLEAETCSIEKVEIEIRAAFKLLWNVKITDIQFGQIHLSILDEYTLQFVQIHFCNLTNTLKADTATTLYNFDKNTVQFGQKHFAI